MFPTSESREVFVRYFREQCSELFLLLHFTYSPSPVSFNQKVISDNESVSTGPSLLVSSAAY